jgi:hypothetical protein
MLSSAGFTHRFGRINITPFSNRLKQPVSEWRRLNLHLIANPEK